jgi:hypothetical protein
LLLIFSWHVDTILISESLNLSEIQHIKLGCSQQKQLTSRNFVFRKMEKNVGFVVLTAVVNEEFYLLGYDTM